MRDVPYKATNVPILDEPGHTFRHIIQETHRVAEKIHGAQDPGGLAEQLLRKGHRGVNSLEGLQYLLPPGSYTIAPQQCT